MTKPSANPPREIWIIPTQNHYFEMPQPISEVSRQRNIDDGYIPFVEAYAYLESQAKVAALEADKVIANASVRELAERLRLYEHETETVNELKEELRYYKNEFENCAQARLSFNDDLKEQYKKIEALEAENKKYRQEMDKMQQGIPSEWAYAILRKERDALRERVDICTHEIKTAEKYLTSCGYGVNVIESEMEPEDHMVVGFRLALAKLEVAE